MPNGLRGKKPPYTDNTVIKKVRKAKETGSKNDIKIYSRRSTIIPAFVGLRFLIHNGKSFVPLFVKEDMVGFKFGDFAMTRNFKGHSGDKKGNNSPKVKK